MNKIYVFKANRFGPTDISCLAVADDGDELANHVSSNESFARFDMGVTSKNKHEIYKKKFPEGFEVIWVDDWKSHPFLSEQAKKNQEKEIV